MQENKSGLFMGYSHLQCRFYAVVFNAALYDLYLSMSLQYTKTNNYA